MKKIVINKQFIYLLVLAIFLLFTNLKVNADTGITISPTGEEVKLKTQQEYKNSFTITNNEQADLNLRFKEAQVNNNSFEPQELEWVKIDNSNLIIEKGENLTINYTLVVPENTLPGTYTRLLITEFYSNESEISLNLALPLRLTITVESLFTDKTGVQIKQFELSNKLIFNNKIDLSVTIGNESSNSISKPIGYLNIINPIGQIIYTKVLNESMSSVTEDVTYNQSIELPSTGFTDIGQYTVQLLVTDASNQKSAIKKLTFVSIYQIYLLIFAVAFVLGLLIIKFGKGIFKIFTTNYTDSEDNELGIKKTLKKKSAK